ncbi:YcxB family protein [Comamonas terrae]|uniref:YcxB family protein n=1 Tax=Comamonas terrae TaxID=673548 RepID=A0ABW5UIH4_9BURK|nr:YcxB family protein [Comamonas terrae]
MAEPAYTISENPYVGAQRLHARFKPCYLRLFLWAASLAGVLMPGPGLYYRHYWLAPAGLAYAMLPWATFRCITQPMARRAYRRYPAMQQPQTVAVQEDMLRIQSSVGETRLPWNLIIQWAEDAEFLLIYLQPRLFLAIARQAGAEATVLAPLREQLLRHVGPARR